MCPKSSALILKHYHSTKRLSLRVIYYINYILRFYICQLWAFKHFGNLLVAYPGLVLVVNLLTVLKFKTDSIFKNGNINNCLYSQDYFCFYTRSIWLSKGGLEFQRCKLEMSTYGKRDHTLC